MAKLNIVIPDLINSDMTKRPIIQFITSLFNVVYTIHSVLIKIPSAI